MNTTSVIIGVVVLLYGFIMLITRFTKPDRLLRLGFMQRLLGDRTGDILHTLIYIIAPFALAYYLVNHGLDGESLKQIFTPPQAP